MNCNRTFLKKIICLLLVFVFNSILLPPAGAASEAGSLAVVSNFDREIFGNYKAKTGITIDSTIDNDIEQAIATAYAIQDDRVDIYFLTAYMGLYLVKEKDFYVPLNESEILQQEYQKLYPGIQKAVSDDDQMIGWIFDVQPQMQLETDILNELELKIPLTFDAFLDACEYIMENDLLDGKYRMLSVYDYTQTELLNLYMKLYVNTSYLTNQIPNFKDEAFLQTVERIKERIPEKQELGYAQYGLDSVFRMSVVFPYPMEKMLPLPQVMEGHNNAIETYATIAIINPFSKNKEEAIKFLEYCALNPEDPDNKYFYDSTMTEPIVNATMLGTYNKLQAELDGYLQLETLTQEQKDRVAQLEIMIPEYKAKSYKISPEAIEHYAVLAQNLLVNEGSPVSYDAQLRQYASQYLSGLMTLEQFSQKCQSHIERIFKELE